MACSMIIGGPFSRLFQSAAIGANPHRNHFPMDWHTISNPAPYLLTPTSGAKKSPDVSVDFNMVSMA